MMRQFKVQKQKFKNESPQQTNAFFLILNFQL